MVYTYSGTNTCKNGTAKISKITRWHIRYPNEYTKMWPIKKNVALNEFFNEKDCNPKIAGKTGNSTSDASCIH